MAAREPEMREAAWLGGRGLEREAASKAAAGARAARCAATGVPRRRAGRGKTKNELELEMRAIEL